MLIEQVFPKVIGGKSDLHGRLAAEGRDSGLSVQEIEALLSIIPLKLLTSACFLDRHTNLWRYEFGLPYTIGENQNQYLWGTHMWLPVKYLFEVVRCAGTRLPALQRRRYFERLANPEKHRDILAEFLPILRLPKGMVIDFEVLTGVGNRDADWRIVSGEGRPVLIEVKSRFRDLLEAMDRLEAGERDPDGTAPAPVHNVSLLFQSIEQKYAPHDPALQLQGAWIETYLKQEEGELTAAFNFLDKTRVHFVILGDWEPGIELLTQRNEDREFLLALFREEISDRFHFSRSQQLV